jgi:arylsulfatase A-like enzyme
MDVGFMGDQRYQTPNIDRLAAQGMIFTQGYAAAANCAPSRACALSGQYPMRHGVYTVGSSSRGSDKTRKLIPTKNSSHVPENNLVLTEVFQKAGYTTCQIGKWHISQEPTTQGVDINVGGSSWGHPKSYFSPYRNPKLKDGPKGEYLTDRLTDEAIQFLKDHQHKKFFLYFPYYTVHTPLQGRKDLVPKYQNTSLNPNYAAMIEALDENIGRLLNAVDQLGLYERTMVIFTSDNGGIRSISSQAPLRAGKGSYYEGGVRVPFAIRWPQHIKAESHNSTPVTGLDFYPTFLEAAGLEVPEGKLLDGHSLLPILTQKETLINRTLFWHFPIYLQAYNPKDDDGRDPLFRTRPGSSMRDGKWKLHEYFEDSAYELYDLESDPGERKNLASSHPEKVMELSKKLNTWRASLKAPVPTELNSKYDPDYLPKSKKKK